MKPILDQLTLTWRLLFDKRVPIWAKLAVILPILYVISPFDFLPDVIIGLGQLDDLGIMLAGMKLFETLAPEYVVTEHRTSLQRLNANVTNTSDPNTVNTPKYTVKK